MSDRETILRRVRSQPQVAHALPDLNQAWIEYPDAVAQFQASLTSVGGIAHVVDNAEQLNQMLAEDVAYTSAAKIYSQVPAIVASNVDLQQMQRPHDAEDVDFALFLGQFAVAENGAVWLETSSMKHRSILFIAQHVSLVVPADQVVHNMHQAYARISFAQPGFGIFVSGPSKTADIEQSLVIGAHGPRSLRVFLIKSGLGE